MLQLPVTFYCSLRLNSDLDYLALDELPYNLKYVQLLGLKIKMIRDRSLL